MSVGNIYSVSIELTGDDEPTPVKWTNEAPGPRQPGPFKAKTPNFMNVGTGFPPDMRKPLIKFDQRPKQKPLYEAYQFGEFWCVSDKVRSELLALDADAFDSVAIDTYFPGRGAGPNLWLMEVVRFCDCLDEDQSIAAGARVTRDVIELNILNRDKNVFSSKLLGSSQIFRLSKNWLFVLCTEQVKQKLELAEPQRFFFSEVGSIGS